MKLLSTALAMVLSLAQLAAASVIPGRSASVTVQRHTRGPKPARRRASDLDAFVRALRAHGLKVSDAGKVSQPFFTPEGRAFTVGGENVQVFRYPSARAAEAEAKKVDAGGTSVGTSAAMWVGPPHFFKKGRLVVLYVGADAGVLKALVAVLGPQFAGR